MGNFNSHPNSEVVLEEKSRSESLFNKLLESPGLKSDPLFGPTLRRQLPVLQLLLARDGAPEKKEGSQGFSVLHLCVVLQWREGLLATLEAGAPVDLASDSGYTALHLAAFLSWAEGCHILLEHGARPDVRTHRGSTARHFAAQQSSRPVLELLIAGADAGAVNSPGFRSRTPLHLAVLAHGDPGIVKLLLEKGANASTRNAALHGITPLHTAAHHGRVEAMRALLDANANPNCVSDDGISPLLEVFAHPSMRHSEEALRNMFTLLRNAGADVNCLLPRQGYSLLHFAVSMCGQEGTAMLLLDSGVDPSINVNHPLSLFDPRSRSTMLHKAAKRGWAAVTRRLLAAGADPAVRDRDGMQPLHVAVINKRPEVARELLSAGADAYARGPNVYPSFSAWRMNRGMQAIQAMMEMQPEAMEALQQLLGEPQEEMSAVDMACCVAQSIPCVEVFLSVGAVPSDEALKLAEKDTPIMRTIVERPFWSPELHQLWPASFKSAVQVLLKCLRRATAAGGVELPPQVVAEITHRLAYPVSHWADADWLAKQRVRQPEQPELALPGPFAAAFPGIAQGGGAGAAAAPPGLANFMGQVMQQLAEALGQGGPAAGDDEEEDDDEEEEEEQGEGELGPGVGGAGAGAGPGIGGPLLAGLAPHVVHQQALGPHMHLVQLEINIPFAQLLDGPPGLLMPPPLHGALGGGPLPPGAVPAPFGLPGFIMHAFPGGPLFPPHPFVDDDGESDDDEEDDEDEEEDMAGGAQSQEADAAAAASPASIAGTAAQAGEPTGSGQARGEDSMPGLETDSDGEGEGGSADGAPGPSTRAGGRSKRPACGSPSPRYNTRSRSKRHKSG